MYRGRLFNWGTYTNVLLWNITCYKILYYNVQPGSSHRNLGLGPRPGLGTNKGSVPGSGTHPVSGPGQGLIPCPGRVPVLIRAWHKKPNFTNWNFSSFSTEISLIEDRFPSKQYSHCLVLNCCTQIRSLCLVVITKVKWWIKCTGLKEKWKQSTTLKWLNFSPKSTTTCRCVIW